MCRSRRWRWSFSAACIALWAAFALCLSASPLRAGDAVLTWTLATANTDGSAIPANGAGSLTGTRIEWGSCSGSNFGTKAGEQMVASPATTYTVTNLAPGTYCFRAYSRNTYGQESAPTNAVSKTIAIPIPMPPGPLTLVAGPVYTLVKGRDALVMLPVGTAPGGETCDTATAVVAGGATYYAIPRASVTFSGSVRPEVVFGRCGA